MSGVLTVSQPSQICSILCLYEKTNMSTMLQMVTEMFWMNRDACATEVKNKKRERKRVLGHWLISSYTQANLNQILVTVNPCASPVLNVEIKSANDLHLRRRKANAIYHMAGWQTSTRPGLKIEMHWFITRSSDAQSCMQKFSGGCEIAAAYLYSWDFDQPSLRSKLRAGAPSQLLLSRRLQSTASYVRTAQSGTQRWQSATFGRPD